MIGLLALIGLIVLLWFASKALTKIGRTLTNLGDALINMAAEYQHVRAVEMNRADSQCVSSKDYQSGAQFDSVQTVQERSKPEPKKKGKAIPVARKIIWD